MNLNQNSQPTERVGIGKRIADLWNSRNKIARLTILAATGLVLNCCCVIIPLSGKVSSLAAQSKGNAIVISTPASATAQGPFIPTTPAISADSEFDHTGEGRLVCKNFNAQAAAPDAQGAKTIRLDGRDKDGRPCVSLP